jgi:hypothetical protein
MVVPTRFDITLPSSGSVPSAFWEVLNWGAVDRILWMGVLITLHTMGIKHTNLNVYYSSFRVILCLKLQQSIFKKKISSFFMVSSYYTFRIELIVYIYIYIYIYNFISITTLKPGRLCVPFPMGIFGFFTDLYLPASLCPRGRPRQKWVQG